MNLWDKITPDLLFAGVGFAIAFGSSAFPEPFKTPMAFIGMGIMFLGSIFSAVALEWMQRKTYGLHLIHDPTGSQFFVFLNQPPKKIEDPKLKTTWWHCEGTQHPIEIPGDSYYGKFTKFNLESEIPLNVRVVSGTRKALFMGVEIEHGHMCAPLIVEDTEASPSEVFKGERIPSFKVIWAVQGDREHNITSPSPGIQKLLEDPNRDLSAKFLELLKKYNKAIQIIKQIKHRDINIHSERLRDHLSGKIKEAETSGLVRHGRDFDRAVKNMGIYERVKEKSWENVVRLYSGPEKRLRITWTIVALAIAGGIGLYFVANPNATYQLQYWLSQGQNQAFLIIGGVIILGLVYMVLRWRRK